MNIRADFPILKTTMHGKPLIYLDNAATTQKPKQVLDVLYNFYSHHNANVHRTIYQLAESATTLFEQARSKVANFIGADDREIVIAKGTTEAINLVAASWGGRHIHAGDEIVISALEHHSNLLPWQRLCDEKNAKLKIIPVLANGTLDMQAAFDLITKKTKFVAVVHTSNILGTHVNVRQLASYAHAVGAKILVDGAQSIAHQPINVRDLACDFFVFSAHKMFGPTGVGILYARSETLGDMTPYELGGGMVYEADYHTAQWLSAPRKFEAGTPPIAEMIGLGAAIDYYRDHIDFNELKKHETQLCAQLLDGLEQLPDIRLLGPQEELMTSGHLVSFVVDGIHAHDVAAHLDQQGICVRAGHHCAQPLAKRLELTAAVRVSIAGYNTAQEINHTLQALQQLF